MEVECPHLLVRMCWWKGAALAQLIQKNIATSLQWWRCVYLQGEGSSLRASGNSTRVTIENNTAGQAGGGVSSFAGAGVLVESGAALVIQKNIATSLWWRVCTCMTRVKPQGEWEQHTRDDREQHSRTNGGGVSSFAGAGVLVESGAALVIQKNIAQAFMVEVCTCRRGSSLRAVGTAHA